MTAAAAALLELLPETSPARFPAGDDAARRDWHYVPRRRPGLSFRAMDAAQEKADYELLASGLSVSALAAVTTIIGLEDVLDELEGGARHRQRADYSISVFGSPATSDAWAWRFEGHHVSVNVTVAGGALSATPLFLGANRAEVNAPSGAVVTRPLAGEEDLALALFGALPGPQRDECFLGAEAPDDILTTNAPRLDDVPDAFGVRVADLAPLAADAATRLVRHYLDRLPPPDAEERWDRLAPSFGDLRFAFAGEAEHRRPQYYRLAGPTFFVEYDNTQDDANHVHTVLRDPTDDFGDDLLRAHRARAHEPGR
jgi:hypothetical protein